MDGTKTTVLSLEATDTFVGGLLMREIRPTLMVRCKAGNLEVFIDNGTPTEDAWDGATVRLKFDDGPPETFRATESTDAVALFLRDPRKVVGRMKSAKTMLYEFTPFSRGPATVAFEVKGIENVSSETVSCVKAK